MFDVLSSQRFRALPDDLQEHIRENGITFESEEELRHYAESFRG